MTGINGTVNGTKFGEISFGSGRGIQVGSTKYMLKLMENGRAGDNIHQFKAYNKDQTGFYTAAATAILHNPHAAHIDFEWKGGDFRAMPR